jgi:L-aminopeptidase/D-esterase-like protein
MAIIRGLRVGHASDGDARTGCTVLLGPFRGASHTAGHASGSREMDPLSALHVVPCIDALLLTGGSAFGLAAAEGVVGWLEERGLGYETGAARVPIVPAAVIYDLAVGRADRRPDAAMGRAACDAASDEMPPEGAVGAGTGATAGKVLGRDRAARGGLGCAVESRAGHSLFAIVVVNPVGDVLDGQGNVIAGARGPDGEFVRATDAVRSPDQLSFASPSPPTPGTNTVLAAIVTDAPLPRESLAIVARMATAALARRISPAYTPYDGDIIFALSTTEEAAPAQALDVMAWGVLACAALERAIERGVTVG